MPYDNPTLVETVSQTLTSAVADSATYTASYPAGTDEGTFARLGHELTVGGARLAYPADFTLTFGTGDITVTNASGATWPAGTVRLSLKIAGADESFQNSASMQAGSLIRVRLGAPDVSDPNGICESQSDTGAHSLTLDGDLVAGGVAVLDVPRNIIVDSGGADTATLTITGTDLYGNAMTEDIQLNGSTVAAGAKAFKTVTAVASDGTISNGAFVGTGDVLGLPFFLENAGDVLAEIEDGATASAGTALAGVITEATASTGDVRGTYDPNSAMDGATEIDLWIATTDPTNRGVAQA